MGIWRMMDGALKVGRWWWWWGVDFVVVVFFRASNFIFVRSKCGPIKIVVFFCTSGSTVETLLVLILTLTNRVVRSGECSRITVNSTCTFSKIILSAVHELVRSRLYECRAVVSTHSVATCHAWTNIVTRHDRIRKRSSNRSDSTRIDTRILYLSQVAPQQTTRQAVSQLYGIDIFRIRKGGIRRKSVEFCADMFRITVIFNQTV